jgi:hypothetical protein
LTSDQKGALAKLAVMHHAAKFGVGIFRPMTDGHRYDLIFDLDGEGLLRVQCKSATLHGVVVVVSCRSAEEAEAASFGGPTRRKRSTPSLCYFLPPKLFSGRTMVQLRLAPARNNQRIGIHWAEAYEFRATLGQHNAFGAIAQLGERLHGMQEVAGSSPAGSTT